MKHGSLFSGIGGFDLAAQWMGWENVFQVEIDKFCQKVLEKNFPNTIRYTDIKEFDGTKYNGTVDVITGGFPCQDISSGNWKGPQGLNGERSGLWSQYKRIVCEIRPSYIVFENSPNLTFRGLDRVLSDLAGIGYNAEWRCFYASQFGFPHGRKRIYGIAYPKCARRNDSVDEVGILSKVLPEWQTRPFGLPVSFKRHDGNTINECLRIDNGFSKELDVNRIHGCGNAIVPQVAFEIFKAIEQTNKTFQQS